MDKLSRKKYLLKNTLLFAIGNIGTKFISFIMVPLYTYALVSSEYGVINTLESLCGVAIPVVMCSIFEAVRRFLLEPHSDCDAIEAIELTWMGIGAGLSAFSALLFSCFSITRPYAVLLGLYIFGSACSTTLLEFLRGKEKIWLYVCLSLLQSFLLAGFNYMFLVRLHQGISGYYRSYVLAYGICSVLAFLCGGQLCRLPYLHFKKSLFREMTRFSVLLIPNALLWWIIGGADKLMLTFFLSAGATGIYAIAAKLPTILSTVNNVLLQAWQFSAIKERDSTDQEAYTNQMFQVYVCTTSLIGAGLLLLNRPFLQLYVAPEYRQAWQYSPFLIVSAMVNTLAMFAGTSYYVQKDMKGNLHSAMVGAVANVLLNACLIPILGIAGAGIATLISYTAILIFRIRDTRTYVVLHVVTPLTGKLFSIVTLMLLASLCENVWSYVVMGLCLLSILIATRAIYLPILKTLVRKHFR